MPTWNISLTPEQSAFVEKMVKALRAQIKAGVYALERGDFTEVDEAGLDSYLEGLTATPGKGAR